MAKPKLTAQDTRLRRWQRSAKRLIRKVNITNYSNGTENPGDSTVVYLKRRHLKKYTRPTAQPRLESPPLSDILRLTIVVGATLSHIENQLRTLGLALIALSTVIWLFAALLGRWLCRNALMPLTRMASSMATISPADFSQRLATHNSGDELEELGVAFNQLLDRLQASFERQRRFAAEASHQLRTPLTALLGQVDVALRRDRSAAEYQHTLVSVREQTTILGRIVEILMFLTREEMSEAPPQLEKIELNAWVSNHLLSWQHHPRWSDLCLVTDTSFPLWIYAHPELLGQAVDNLLDNACKYSKPDSRINIRPTRLEHQNALVVEDHGYGIREDELPRVVHPFFRSDEARARGIGGSGLGLSVVQRIVDACGAELSVDSRIGHGSVFTIVFQSTKDEGRP